MGIKKSIYFAILFAITTAFLHGLTWPVAEYPKVAVTYGDYSLGEVYPFHSGVDIQCNASIKAIALSNGTVLAKWQDVRLLWNFSFQTDDQKMWIYEHLTSDIGLGYFTEGSEIGTIAHYPWAYGLP